MAKSKLSKSLLKKAKKAAREAGNELPSSRKEIRKATRQVKLAVKENKVDTISVTWNLAVGDLVEIIKSNVKLGCIVAIDSTRAKNIKDYSQYVSVLTKDGVLSLHPRLTKLIQKS